MSKEPASAERERATRLIPAERRARIAKMLRGHRSARVSWLSEELGVSEMTIRRDLEHLELMGVLSRTHGGAILKRHLVGEPVFVDNVSTHGEQKTRIAKAAAAMIQPGETVFLASGTTTLQVLTHLDSHLQARFVTHNAGAISIAGRLSIELIVLGGGYRSHSNAMEGAVAAEMASGYVATKMLLGADALSLEDGVTTPTPGLATVERTMIRQTRGEVIVLATSAKIGAVADLVICPTNRIDTIVVDADISQDIRDEFTRRGIQVVVA